MGTGQIKNYDKIYVIFQSNNKYGSMARFIEKSTAFTSIYNLRKTVTKYFADGI